MKPTTDRAVSGLARPKPRQASWWVHWRSRPDLVWLVLLTSLWILVLLGNLLFGLIAYLRLAQIELMVHHVVAQRAEAATLRANQTQRATARQPQPTQPNSKDFQTSRDRK